jgi:anti-sigma regulatory factor (Ser/Thr protein kinase)
MEDLSLHILDVAENAIDADADTIEIVVDESPRHDRLIVEINDNGRGMDDRTLKKVTDPFFTSRTTRKVGLGIPLLSQAVQEADGDLSIDSEPGRGTRVKASFSFHHIDRKPVGDLAATMTTLVAAHPEVNFIIIHRCDSGEIRLNTAELKQDLGPTSLQSPEGLKYIRQTLSILREDPSTWRGASQGGYYGGSRTGTEHLR